MTAIFPAARPLALRDRDPFLQEVAGLQGIPDPGDGDVARAIRQTQKMFFEYPQICAGCWREPALETY
jgi:hypothetical protein